jgi:hypothetical protein
VVSGLLEPDLETHYPKRLHNQDSGLGSAGYTGRISSVWTRSMVLHFMAAGAPLVARHIQILPMNQND